jgi:hypothetical protein
MTLYSVKEPIRKLILKAVDPHIAVGDTFRLMHEYRRDGRECSLNKDPALSVTRGRKGWAYYCHRCHEQGFISDKKKSPSEVKSMIEKLQNQKTTVSLAKVVLPHDFVPLCKDFDAQMCDYKEGDIPWTAYHWLWKYDIKEHEIDHFNIGWSDGYKRVIIPVYEEISTIDNYDQTQIDKTLKGWVGREVECASKEERKAKKIAKYLTRKEQGAKRLLFKARGGGHFADLRVIVEDIVSAIKIWKVTGATSVALLNSHINNDIIKECQGRTTYVWLDRDMLTKAISCMNRLRQFGVDAHNITTYKDPKAYNSMHIRQQIIRAA